MLAVKKSEDDHRKVAHARAIERMAPTQIPSNSNNVSAVGIIT